MSPTTLTPPSLPGHPASLEADLDHASALVAVGNFPQAELHVRRYQAEVGHSARATQLLQLIALGYGMPQGFALSERAVRNTDAPRYLFIRAWGHGFWSDVHHVLGQLLVAELTQRTPVVWWGENSLFRGTDNPNAFELYFEPISTAAIAPLLDKGSYYPSKWNKDNLWGKGVNQWQGAQSRIAAPYLFARDEDIVVSDFYASVAAIRPWIDASSSYFGLSEDEIYLHLCEKYLRPHPSIAAQVDAFFSTHMAGKHWVAVHARGSDKIHESAGLHQTNVQYFGFVDRIIALNPDIGIFLLTDSHKLHETYKERYGDRVVATPALRSASDVGVHFQGHDGYALGVEVMVDVLLATRCDYFIGNCESNVSLAISSFKRWPAHFSFMLGDKNGRSENWYIHRNHVRTQETCRLCRSPVEAAFERQVLARYSVKYYRCQGCGALQTEQPYWLGDAYATKAERFDTGKASRTVINFLVLPQLLSILGIEKSDRSLDFGSGTGLLPRLMRDIGYNYFSCDKYGSGEFAGIYAWKEAANPCRLVTLFEVAEHFDEPATEWARIFALDPEIVIGSTGLFQGQGPDWDYLTPESGQHVFFYSAQALSHLAQAHGRIAYHVGMYFIFSKKPLDPEVLTRIQAWRENLNASGKGTFEHWLSNPYGHASQDNAEALARARMRNGNYKIAIDGVFFRFNTGISRVWRSLLREWSASGFGEFLVVIDRERTAPRYPGISYVDAPQHSYQDIPADRQMLQEICDQERISLFTSTYYTTPTKTPAVLLVHDMIPEIMGFDLTNIQWQEKHQAILYARRFMSISENTTNDLLRFFPRIPRENVTTIYNGTDFHVPSSLEVQQFKKKYSISRPYFVISGVHTDYKNSILFFKAFAKLGDAREGYEILCTNSNHTLEDGASTLVGGAKVHMVVLSDPELQCAYRGSLALVYPSRYEGFGLPILEAMACACPVITCNNSSLSEVGGNAAIYVDPDDIGEMLEAIKTVQIPEERHRLIKLGLEQSRKFSWNKMARQVEKALASWALFDHL